MTQPFHAQNHATSLQKKLTQPVNQKKILQTLHKKMMKALHKKNHATSPKKSRNLRKKKIMQSPEK